MMKTLFLHPPSYEGFDGGDGHGKVGVLREEAVVGVDNAFVLHVSGGFSL